MKVLSLIEPFATLILIGKKRIETRSYKTSYRGKLYIHASMTKMALEDINDKELMSLVSNSELNQGKIVCKCNLVDCIYMSKEYVDQMKKENHQEYICGDYKEGRYAWVLEDIIPLKEKMRAKGKLGIWNYYNELEIMELMDEIEYGWVDKNNLKHYLVDDSYSNNYILQKPSELIKNKVGVCWDQVELERYYFKNTFYNIKTYFIVYYDNDKCPTHTFLTFEKNDKHYWFEHSWEKFRGIEEYNSLNELLLDVKNKFIRYELNNNYKKDNLVIREYKKPKYHLTVQEFYKHCEEGILVKDTNNEK